MLLYNHRRGENERKGKNNEEVRRKMDASRQFFLLMDEHMFARAGRLRFSALER